jgi:hypothetical protein
MLTLTEGPRTMAREPEPGELWTTDQVAERLNLSPRTVTNWRHAGKGPRSFRLGTGGKAPVRYRAVDVLAWIDEWRDEHGPPEDDR